MNSIKWREENYKECRNWNAIKLVINKIEIVLDTSSIEIFIGNGEKTMSMRFFSHEKLDTLSVTSTGGYIRNFISHEIVVNSWQFFNPFPTTQINKPAMRENPDNP